MQKFIEAARSVRDLWSGSAILSWLTFQGILPVIEKLGPTALIYPALRGNPLMDLWLHKEGGLENIPLPSKESCRSPSLPNRFVALVPWGPEGVLAKAMEDACDGAVGAAWRRLAKDVHDHLNPTLAGIDPDWSRLWQEQVNSFFEVRTAAIPIHDLNDETLPRLIEGKDSFDEVWPAAHAGASDTSQPVNRHWSVQRGYNNRPQGIGFSPCATLLRNPGK